MKQLFGVIPPPFIYLKEEQRQMAQSENERIVRAPDAIAIDTGA